MANKNPLNKLIIMINKIEKQSKGSLKNDLHNIKQNVNSMCKKFEKCWLCGTSSKITLHHLQKRRKRKDALGTIPLCIGCHNDVEKIKKAIEICKGEKKLSTQRFKEIIETMELWK